MTKGLRDGATEGGDGARPVSASGRGDTTACVFVGWDIVGHFGTFGVLRSGRIHHGGAEGTERREGLRAAEL